MEKGEEATQFDCRLTIGFPSRAPTWFCLPQYDQQFPRSLRTVILLPVAHIKLRCALGFTTGKGLPRLKIRIKYMRVFRIRM
jgi:hypothetical protein